MSDDTEEKKPDNVIRLRIQGKKPGSPGRAGREDPRLGDQKTADALFRVRQMAQNIDRTKYAEPDQPIELADPREEDFSIYATSGFSLAAAWRMAFDADGDVRGEHKGAKLASVPRVALRINELLEQRRNVLVDEAERIRALISARLEREATEAAEGSVRLKAIELLGKQPHVAAFEDRTRTIGVNERSSAHDIEAELLKRLRSLRVVS